MMTEFSFLGELSLLVKILRKQSSGRQIQNSNPETGVRRTKAMVITIHISNGMEERLVRQWNWQYFAKW